MSNFFEKSASKKEPCFLVGDTRKRFFEVRLQIPLFSEQDNFLLKRGLRIIF